MMLFEISGDFRLCEASVILHMGHRFVSDRGDRSIVSLKVCGG